MPMNRPGAVAAAHMGADSYTDAQPTAAHEKIKNSRRGATDGRGVLHRGVGGVCDSCDLSAFLVAGKQSYARQNKSAQRG